MFLFVFDRAKIDLMNYSKFQLLISADLGVARLSFQTVPENVDDGYVF